MSLVRPLSGLPKQKSLVFSTKKRSSNNERSSAMTIPEAIQALKERLIFDTKSVWSAAEVLYYINITKNYLQSSNGDISTNTNSQNKGGVKLRFLLILKKKDPNSFSGSNSSGSYHLLQASVKDNGIFNRSVNVKNSWDLRKIRGVDIGSGSSDEIILSVEKGDVTYLFSSTLDRDETTWIIIQLCKLVATTNTDIIDTFSVGYSVDIEAISYTIVTNGTLNRFPSLYKIFNNNGLLNTDAFGEEEGEAESLLDDLKWSTDISSSSDLQQTLSRQSGSLNMQIIDYLLQWEELDDSSRQTSNQKSFGQRNTVEILDALNRVDSELEETSVWLNIQIERLTEVKSHLVLIEDESGGLESSWTNLQSIRDIINAVVTHLTIDPSSEMLLRNPEPVLLNTLKASTLVNTEQFLAPLISAALKLLEALFYKGEENIVPLKIWKKIRNMKAIVEQKEKLYKLADAFSYAATESLCHIFPGVLKHKSLNDEKTGKTIDVKSFKIQQVIVHRKKERRKVQELSTPSTADESNIDQSVSALYYVPSELNVLYSTEKLYHESLLDYIALIEKVTQMSPSSAGTICKAYIDTVNEKFYAPLFKNMMREFRTLMPSSRSPVTLASISRYQYKGLREVAVRFSTRESLVNETQIQLLPPWELFAIFLLVVTPVILREEAFFQALFNIESGSSESQAREWLLVFTDPAVKTVPVLTETNSNMATIFQTLVHLVHKLSAYSSSDVVTRASTINTGSSVQASTPIDADVDVVETVGLLAVLYQFVYNYLDNGNADAVLQINQASNKNSNDFEVTSSVVMLMYEMRGIFLTRLNAFQVEQVKWIQSCKWDIKKPGVSLPFSKFTSLTHQILEMVCGQMIDHVDIMVGVLAKELMSWLNAIAEQNPKHADVFKLQNLTFFEETLSEMSEYYASIKVLIDEYVITHRQEAESRYILWMITYEIGSLANFANKVDRLGTNVREEELALYITSKESQVAAKELMDAKKLDAMVLAIRKRLKKHCESSDDHELQIVGKVWNKIKIKVIEIMQKFAHATTVHKTNFDISPKQISAVFDKYSNK